MVFDGEPLYFWTSDFWPKTISSRPHLSPLTFLLQNLITSSLPQLHLRCRPRLNLVKFPQAVCKIWSCSQTYDHHGRTDSKTNRRRSYRLHRQIFSLNEWAWKPRRRNVLLRHYRSVGLVMTLTFDLWPWKPFEQCPLTRWIFVVSFTAIPALSKEIRHVTRCKC